MSSTSTSLYNRVKRFQNRSMPDEDLPQITLQMINFFRIWHHLLRRIIRCTKMFSTRSYQTTRNEHRLKKIQMNAMWFFTIHYSSLYFESNEIVVRAFMYMMRVMPPAFVNEVFYFIEKTVCEPRFEEYWKNAQREALLREPNSALVDKEYEAINALKEVSYFFRGLYPVPPKICVINLIWRDKCFMKVELSQHFSKLDCINSQKRKKMLLMSGFMIQIVSSLFFNPGIFPLNSQLSKTYLKCFGEKMLQSICRSRDWDSQ